MARRANQRDMGAGQRKTRRRMIDRSVVPGSCVMTVITVVAVVEGHMVWIIRRLIICLVALVAGAIGEIIIAIHMTCCTLDRHMGSS